MTDMSYEENDAADNSFLSVGFIHKVHFKAVWKILDGRVSMNLLLRVPGISLESLAKCLKVRVWDSQKRVASLLETFDNRGTISSAYV